MGPDGKRPVPFARDRYTRAQLDDFLARLRRGGELDIAATGIGSTGGEMRRFRSREPAFDEAITEAMAEGQQAYEDRLRATARARATDLHNGSDRILEVELATHAKGYEHLRRDRVKVTGQISHEHSLVLDVSALERLPVEQQKQLRAILLILDGADPADVVDATDVRELGPGE